MKKTKKGPRILILDIETAPMINYTWGIWEQNVSLDQIKQDWHVLAWSAKWLDEKKVIYADQRNAKDITDDKKLLEGIWKLMDEADIVVGQNSNSFDIKKLNARFILNGFKPPSGYKKMDTKLMAKKHFAFTSNKLEFMTEKLNTKYKKLKHDKYPGFSMWLACMAGEKAAWKEMERYNKHDVLATEELYKKLLAWDMTVNFNLYHEEEDHVCSCGSTEFIKYGYAYTAAGKFQRYTCKSCGKESRSKTNLFSKEKRKALHARIT